MIWCCFNFCQDKGLSKDEIIALLENEKKRGITSLDDIVKAAAKDTSLSALIISNADYRKTLQPYNIAKILTAKNNKGLALSLVDLSKPNIPVLKELQLHHLLQITRIQPQFFLNLLDLKKRNYLIPALSDINTTNKMGYIRDLALLDKRICQRLIVDHPTIFNSLLGTQLKTIAEQDKKFGRWLVTQPTLMSKISAHSQKKLCATFAEIDDTHRAETQPLLRIN